VSTSTETIRPTVFASGYKGTLFVSGLFEAGIHPARIVSYRQHGDKSESFDRLIALCRNRGIEVEESHQPQIDKDALVFLVGWQFLLRAGLDRCVVLHDSLLPNFRGFSPTVTAMLLDAAVVGVTAVLPNDRPDSGPICGSRTVEIGMDDSLRDIIERQIRAMVDLAREILQRAATGTLVGRAQDQNAATYSLWRDEADYFLDWRLSASEILRHVRALGFPYDGAKAVMNNRVVTIDEASPGPDVVFALRNPGKLWQIDGRRALVVCGQSTLWIDRARDDSGMPFHFNSLRARFLTADTAWITAFIASGNGPK
jgi:methionyl-tRNA formyltransferase